MYERTVQASGLKQGGGSARRAVSASGYQRAHSCYLNLSEDSKPAIAKRRNQLKSGRSESLNPVVIVMLSQIHGKAIFMLAATLVTASSRHDRNGFVTARIAAWHPSWTNKNRSVLHPKTAKARNLPSVNDLGLVSRSGA